MSIEDNAWFIYSMQTIQSNGKGRPFQYFGSSNVWNFKKKSEKITVSLIDWTHVSMQQHLKKKNVKYISRAQHMSIIREVDGAG